MTEARNRMGTDAPIAAVLVLTTSVGFSSWFSRPLFSPETFDRQYHAGVYRYRVLGREAVWFLHRVLGNPLGEHLAPRNPAADPGGMFTALTLVNGLCLAGTCYLLHRMLGASRLVEPHRTLVYLTVAALVAATSYVVTPYDQLSYLLLLALLLAARARPPFDLAAPVLAVVGVLNRETQFLAIAALVAAAWPLRRPWSRRSAVAIAAGVAATITYGGLRLAIGGDGHVLWSSLTLAGNVGRLAGVLGAAVMVAMLWWWRAVCSVVGLGIARASGPLRRYWLLSAPYALVAGLTGYWIEARLLTPLLLGELWVRLDAAGPPEPLGSPGGATEVAGHG